MDISKIDLSLIPTYDIQDRVGNTHYIDFITPEEMPHNVVKGIDFFRRPFIAI
jgi:hypothetical protein